MGRNRTQYHHDAHGPTRTSRKVDPGRLPDRRLTPTGAFSPLLVFLSTFRCCISPIVLSVRSRRHLSFLGRVQNCPGASSLSSFTVAPRAFLHSLRFVAPFAFFFSLRGKEKKNSTPARAQSSALHRLDLSAQSARRARFLLFFPAATTVMPIRVSMTRSEGRSQGGCRRADTLGRVCAG